LFVDSIFLNNQPAPAALLGAFGITQGATSSADRYYFITQDPLMPKLRSNVLSLNLNASGTVITGGSFDNDFYNTISIEKFGQEMQPKLFPNPVKEDGRIAISFNKVLDKTLRLEVFNMNGSMIQTSTLEMGSNEYSIELNSAAAGMYFLRFVDQNGKIVFGEKIIRQ
ncbi:MAG: T9SS C-terminal target domain-containing protein, partial [Flavobacteriales bacterium]